MKDNALLGEIKKYQVTLTDEGFDMATGDFEILIKRGSVSKTYRKVDLVEETDTATGEKRYYIVIDTTYFGPGVLTAVCKAFIPDTDCPDGFRVDMVKFDLLTTATV